MSLRPLALAAACLASPCMAQSTVTIYGGFDLAPQWLQQKSSTTSAPLYRLNSNSILGFRGSEDLGGGLRAIWQSEGSVGADTGTGAFSGRNTHVGLSGAAGTISLGHWDTPYKSSTMLIDPFTNTRTTGYANVTGGNAQSNGGNAVARASFVRRQSNSLQYWSPSFGAVSFRLGVSANEEKSATANPWLGSASLAYRRGGVFLTYAFDHHHDYGGGDTRDQGHKIGATWRSGPWLVGGMLERLSWHNGSLSGVVKGVATPAGTRELQLDSVFLTVTRAFGPGSVIATYGQDAGLKADGRRIDQSRARSLVLNYTYDLSKQTQLYVDFAELRNQANSANNFSINNATGVTPGTVLRAASAGIKLRY